MVLPDGTRRYILNRRIRCRQRVGRARRVEPIECRGSRQRPTITREAAFALSWGCGWLTKGNLSDIVSTDPKGLRGIERLSESDETLALMAHRADVLVPCWGAGADKGPLLDRADEVLDLLDRMRRAGVPLQCFGVTKSGAPKHPLYLRSDTPLRHWRGRATERKP
jgi:hypothetical protein